MWVRWKQRCESVGHPDQWETLWQPLKSGCRGGGKAWGQWGSLRYQDLERSNGVTGSELLRGKIGRLFG